MNNFDASSQMSVLLMRHEAAKSQMTKGIVGTVIGYFLACFGLGGLAFYFLGLILLIPGIIVMVSGIRNIIQGSKARLQANREIKELKEQQANETRSAYDYNFTQM